MSAQFHGVTFRYSEISPAVIRDCSFQVAAGTLLAITGKSGVGKSTLGRLLIGLQSPNSGFVTIDGLSPAEFIKSQPGAVSYVPQDVHLVRGTIAENVALGVNVEDIDANRVVESLREAQAQELLELPLGENTSLIDSNLSGGQKQRLGIARALYTQPKLILLDEPTSALDAKTESALLQTLRNLKGSTTLVVIAHRQTTIEAADAVLNLVEGTSEFVVKL